MPEAVTLHEERDRADTSARRHRPGPAPAVALKRRIMALVPRRPLAVGLVSAVAAAAILATFAAQQRLAEDTRRARLYAQALAQSERVIEELRAGKAALAENGRVRLAQLEQELESKDAALAQVERDREALERRLAAARRERDEAVALGRTLNQRLAALEQRAEQLAQVLDLASTGMRRWAGGPLEEFEALLAEAGLDLADLVERASELSEREAGQGGPLELLGEEPSLELAALEPTHRVLEDLKRLDTTRRLLKAMPLAAPLETYTVTSEFGVRSDPLTGGRAVHRGLDLTGPRGTEILAPAAGRVISAGRSGAYGIRIEIDHGMGIVTRYAHLRKALVKAGDVVEPGTVLGVIGSTGRSTGRHLHYEVLMDGKEIDPAALIEAGRKLGTTLGG
ncbi:M23 family metallopeptidase [Marinimicrococcus flavescens]|uniref:Peptidoglycan DD-metalloendopeptidase family protein n=1 Tax=Marinimicrococcus flavescens TaxID=3031815 RepID=A0AAP3V0W1_9PROT|nr:peptidoglycan DD-metalloendopeptidase family protein [Marinimicrococcus flavescens]